jgi:signal transduction histidine kinase
VRNLLENAGRHGAPPSEVALAATSPSWVRLDVCDRGPGIPEAEREAIFTPFYRRAGASEADGGVGLGLSLVRQIVRRHGGDAVCLPREGGGCRFRVTLPMAPPDR